MALAKCVKRVVDLRAVNPGKEIPDVTEEDVKAEYVAMAGLLLNEEAVGELEERAKHNDFVNKSGAVKKLKEGVAKRPKKAK